MVLIFAISHDGQKSPMNKILLLVGIYFLSCPSASGFGGKWGLASFQPQLNSLKTLRTSLMPLHAQRRGRPRGPLRTVHVKPPMNNEIEQDLLRVVTINPKGKDNPLGVMSKADALSKAKELGGLDLILINSNSDPPVCKIADYSKYRYMKEKKAKDLKKNSKASELKEVKMSYKIDVHDYNVRKKSAEKFISRGDRVKCTVIFKGREVQHDKLGFELLDKLAVDMEKVCTMEGRPKREGRQLSCIMSPKAEILKSISVKKRADEKSLRREKEATRVIMEEEAAEKLKPAADMGKPVNVALTTDDEDSDLNDSELSEILGKSDLMDNLFG